MKPPAPGSVSWPVPCPDGGSSGGNGKPAAAAGAVENGPAAAEQVRPHDRGDAEMRRADAVARASGHGVAEEDGGVSPSHVLWHRGRAAVEHCRITVERSSRALRHSQMALERGRGRRRTDAARGVPPERFPTDAGRLIAAQEEERRRMSLELHDAVGQRVAATCISLRRLQYRLRDDGGAARQLEEVLDVLGELVHAVRHMSHAMHPPVLELAGLGAALRGHCHELRTLARFEVDVADDDLPPVPPDAALCLFRVAQEALGNVLAHAGVKRAALGVSRHGGGLELVVSDQGTGFDLAGVVPGLGLVGMRERVRLLGGTLAVRSEPGQGTVVRAWIPLAPPEDGDPAPV